MKLYCISAKHLFIIILTAITIFVCIGAAGIMPVFKVGNREIPIYSVKRDDAKISLTFNCAWGNEDISSILQTLDEFAVKCTFFIVGDWAKKFPESVKEIYDKGHEIANHSYSHAHYSKMSRDEILSDIEKCDELLYEICGKKPMLFRAAYGEYNDNVVNVCEQSGRYYIQWSVDSIDYGEASQNDIFIRSTQKTQSGDIILMHTGTKNTAKILPKVLEELSHKFDLCPVSELIYTKNYIIDATGKQIKN